MKKIAFLLVSIIILSNTTSLRSQETEMDELTPLMKATSSDDNKDEVIRLVEAGADILEEDENGNNAIAWADYFGSYEISNYLHRVLMVYMFYDEIVPLKIGKYDTGSKSKVIKCNNYHYTLSKIRLNNGILVGVFLQSSHDVKKRKVYSMERNMIISVIEAIYKGKMEGVADVQSDDNFSFLMGFEKNNNSFQILWDVPKNEWTKYKEDNSYNFKCDHIFSMYDIDLYDQWKKEGH